MTSLLEDANRMLELGYGDLPRLKQIKETLEANKMLYVSERKYLNKLTKDHPEQSEVKTKTYGSQTPTQESSGDMDIDELEEKIRVDSEPS
jgi:hypothetical protein